MIDLSPFPRIKLAQLPTPLQPLKRLSALLDGPTIWIKRDDCTGLALGGNKTRKLEFLMGEAQHQQAELIVTFGAVQSNHVRQTVAACAQLGFPCEPILSRSVDFDEDSYRLSGNLFLDQLLGATIHQVNPEDVKATFRALLDRESRRVYAIPAGGSNATGSLGYVHCAREISAQVDNLGIEIKTLVHATSSAGTQAGLIVGMANETRGPSRFSASMSMTQMPATWNPKFGSWPRTSPTRSGLRPFQTISFNSITSTGDRVMAYPRPP